MKKESLRLDKEIRNLSKELKQYPLGDLRVKKNGKYTTWHIFYKDKTKEYLHKKDYKLAKKMAKKILKTFRMQEKSLLVLPIISLWITKRMVNGPALMQSLLV